MKIIYVGELIRTPDAPDHKGVRQGLQWLKEDGIISDWDIVDPVLNDYPEVIRQCNEHKAELYIHGNTDSLNRAIIPNIEYGKQVFFMGDVQPTKREYPFWDNWVKNSKGLSAIFITNRTQIPMWEEDFGVPAHFWPHGCFVPETLEYDSQFEHEVLFIGSMNNGGQYQARYDLIKEIEKEVKITYITRNDVEGRNQIWRDMPKLYHSSKIVLDVSHFWDLDGYASGRYWYSAGLGGCSVTKYFPGCEDFYANGKEKWYFKTPKEAVEIIQMLLDSRKVREITKQNAFERNKKDHNYRKRFLDLLSKI